MRRAIVSGVLGTITHAVKHLSDLWSTKSEVAETQVLDGLSVICQEVSHIGDFDSALAAVKHMLAELAKMIGGV